MATLAARLMLLVAAIGIDIKALQAASGPPSSLIGAFPGPVANQVGSLRYYPKTTLNLVKITAWLSANAGANVTAAVRKNGVILDTITINAGSLTANKTVAYTILASDYLTMDIQTGSGYDLTIRLDY